MGRAVCEFRGSGCLLCKHRPWPGLMSGPYSVSIPSSLLTAPHTGEAPSLKQPSPTGEKEEAGCLQFEVEPNLHQKRKLDSKRGGY